MRIERVELDGFGRFREARWALEPGITILVGANEAGKTTLLNAVRAVLFGFEPTRDGRTWYPALAGGRRGGRLVLRTSSDERWVVERHGEKGGGGSLAVRAPNGNQGGQETLDRLLRGADRDLFNNIFAFGLGELQTLASLSADAVRGRIYGAGAGLGGTSAVDLERRLRQQLDAIYLPRGQRPLNALLNQIEDERLRIAELERQPQEFEAAHRERDAASARAADLRAAVHERRERSARLGRLRAAGPVAAELSMIEAELAAGDASLDDVPVDAVAALDRTLGELAEARATLATIDEELEAARAARDALVVDEALLARAAEVAALGEERARRSGAEARRAELRAAEARHAAVVGEQRARAGGWEEARLVALDDSIAAVEATRTHEQSMSATASAALEAEQRRRAAEDELALREGEGLGPDLDGEDLERRAAALRDLDDLRVRRAGAEAAAARPGIGLVGSRRAALAAAGLALGVGLLLGALVGAPLPGALLGALAGGLVVALAWTGRRSTDDLESLGQERASLLATLGMAPDASDSAVRAAAEELAAMRARQRLSDEREAAMAARREELARRERESASASVAADAARASWASWLAERDLADGLSPEAARQLLAAAGTARRAAEERDHQSRFLSELDADDARFAARAEALLGELGIRAPADAASRDVLVVDLLARLEDARSTKRRCEELVVTLERLDRRRTPADQAVATRQDSVDAYLAKHRCVDPDGLRRRAAMADGRRLLHTHARELRAELAGIAGSLEAIDPLVAEAAAIDAPAMAAEQAEVDADLVRFEAEERDTLNAIGALDARIRDLEASDELGLRRQQLAGLEGRAAAMSREWAVRALALRLLEETRTRYERERQPDVVRAAEAHFERITGGAYSRIVAPPGDAAVRVETEGGEVRATDELSRGTAEQLYLALRFGLIEEFANHAEPLPVVMDDILVNFDTGRAARAAASIRDLAERHQVLYFTCHRWTAELLDPSGARTMNLEAAATIA
jgi:uncharacterized protein YhaN